MRLWMQLSKQNHGAVSPTAASPLPGPARCQASARCQAAVIDVSLGDSTTLGNGIARISQQLVPANMGRVKLAWLVGPGPSELCPVGSLRSRGWTRRGRRPHLSLLPT